MKFLIELNGDDDAMQRSPAYELYKALRGIHWPELIKAHLWAGDSITHRVRDSNGNSIGTATVQE